MKLNCGPTAEERYYARRARLSNWHKWFAWRPARVGKNDCRWFETIERKLSFSFWYDVEDITAEYRPLTKG